MILFVIVLRPKDLGSIWKCLRTESGAGHERMATHTSVIRPCAGNRIALFNLGNNR